MTDPQLRRGLLDACVLAALCRGESHGYQIVKDLTPSVKISESTLYPILRRLEDAGCLVHRSVEHNGRLRKYYQLTDGGRARIAEFLREWQDVMRIYAFIEGGEQDAHRAIPETTA